MAYLKPCHQWGCCSAVSSPLLLLRPLRLRQPPKRGIISAAVAAARPQHRQQQQKQPGMTDDGGRRRHYHSAGIPPAKQRFVPTSGTYPRGFEAAAVHVGVKASNARAPDLALIVSRVPCAAAAVFTQNVFQAAPVLVSKDTLRESTSGEGGLGDGDGRGAAAVGGEGAGEEGGGRDVRAVVINSGCANAVTGKGGLEDAEAMRKAVDELLRGSAQRDEDTVQSSGTHDSTSSSSSSSKTLVMSTGVIGQRLPIDKILAKIPEAFAQLAPDHASWLAAARAICTTDTFPKLLSRTFRLPSAPDRTFRLAGMTKGAGMIHPNMATLLGTICTDAAAEPAALRQALAYAMERSFNSISIDGDTSTNDTVALLANGAAGGPVIRAPSSSSSSTSRVTSSPASAAARADFVAFRAALTAFAAQLAQLVVRDGEGATKFVAVRVARAPSRAVARAVAASVARSPLVKTALYGCDANWGRVLCAVGYTPGLPAGAIRPAETSVSLRVLPPPPPPGSSAVDGASSSPSSSATDGASSSTDGSSADGSAAAAAAAAIDEELRLLVDGEPQRVDEARAREILEHEDLEIVVHLRKEKKKKGDVVGEKERGGATDGDADAEAEADDTEACYWTCDFSHEYITINADYRT